MLFRNLDENYDWTFGSGKQNYVSKDEAIKLNIRTRILSWKNDCFFDMEAGIDWYQRLGYKSQFNLLQNDLSTIIISSWGVASINSFQANIIDRTFQSQYNIATVYSPSVIQTIERNL